MIPQNFESWKSCITQSCKIELTDEFVLNRIKCLTDLNLIETKRIIDLYGKEHHQNLIGWFNQVLQK